MFRSASRLLLRQPLPARSSLIAARSRRLLSTAPPSQKSRSWKSSAARWALAVGGVYYYSTSDAFAEEPSFSISKLVHPEADPTPEPTVESLVAERRAKTRAEENNDGSLSSSLAVPQPATHDGDEDQPEQSAQDMEDEAGQQGAFNPETGEINWDCPCLGGMAHGPCGEQFRAAFSCFVYSTEEPKGMECIDRFKGMQDCFREHPEIYGDEMDEDEQRLEDELNGTSQGQEEPIPASASSASPTPSVPGTTRDGENESAREKNKTLSSEEDRAAMKDRARAAAAEARKAEPVSESESLVPKAYHDARGGNGGK